jgi:hypothetical protein
MKQKSQNIDIFDSYIRGIDDQELKGILLKLKNEVRKPDVSWEIIKKILHSIWNKDKEAFINVIPMILK